MFEVFIDYKYTVTFSLLLETGTDGQSIGALDVLFHSFLTLNIITKSIRNERHRLPAQIITHSRDDPPP